MPLLSNRNIHVFEKILYLHYCRTLLILYLDHLLILLNITDTVSIDHMFNPQICEHVLGPCVMYISHHLYSAR